MMGPLLHHSSIGPGGDRPVEKKRLSFRAIHVKIAVDDCLLRFSMGILKKLITV